LHDYDDDIEFHHDLIESGTRHRRASRERVHADNRRQKPSPHHHPRKVAEGQESFKCGHCRAFIGPTIAGGRHRNHCPLCLYSRHVDRGRPGDRACDCRSLMEPVGLTTRRNGEQVLVHRCLGCEAERVCRVAADDNPLAIMRLPLVAHPASAGQDSDEVAIDAEEAMA
jgi:hypothetical protein